MRHLIILFLLVVFSVSVKAQESFLHQSLDTVKASDRTGGKNLDSIDLILSEKFTSTPGSYFTHPFGKFGNDYSSLFSTLSKQHRDLTSLHFKYSALPYLGTYYAFGSKGTQYLVVNYHQSFSRKIHFSMSYKRNVSTGAYRYSAFSNDAFSIGALYKGNSWLHSLVVSTLKQQRNLNGGVSSFAEIESYGLEFANVNKQKSSDSLTILQLKTESEWAFGKKDTLKPFAIVFKNQLIIDKRIFLENDTLTNLYPNSVLFDTMKTRDLTQFSRLDNQLGFRYKKKNAHLELLVDRGFWKYKTYSVQFMNEFDLLANASFLTNKAKVRFENQFNLIGANQQTKHSFNLERKSEKYSLQFQALWSNLLPTPFQRKYLTNTLQYIIPDLKLQKTQSVYFAIKSNTKNSVFISAYYGSFQNHYYFLKNQWRNDTLNSISQVSIQAKGDLSLGKLHIQPNFTLNLVDKVQLLPKYDIRTRLFLSLNAKRPGTVFNFGVDVNYKSTHQLLTFDDRISLYQLNFKNGFYKDYWMLDAFVSMQLDEFRLYFKTENLDSFWSSPSNSIAKNYPIVPMVMRLGLTWDFFN